LCLPVQASKSGACELCTRSAARKEGTKLLLIGKLVADEVENIFRKLDNHFHGLMRSDICWILLLIADSDNFWARSVDLGDVVASRDRVVVLFLF
jgi:hypothetical protein